MIRRSGDRLSGTITLRQKTALESDFKKTVAWMTR